MKLTEIYESNEITFELSESRKSGVLGVLKGNFFFSEPHASRNGRVYPIEAWKNALSESNFNQKLNDRLVFGTIGHLDHDPDNLIRENKVSHVLTKVKLNEQTGIGYGEADILDTPIGRTLYTLLKSGSKISVSSKAFGEYKGKDEEGRDIVDSKTFRVERWDAVVDPGFVNARPDLKEQLLEALNEPIKKKIKTDDVLLEEQDEHKIIKEENKMSQQLLEKVLEEKISLEATIQKLTKDLDEAKAKPEVDELKAKCKDFEKKITELKIKAEKYENMVETYGTEDEIESALTLAATIAESTKEYGTPDEIGEALDISKKTIASLQESVFKYEEIGTPEEIEKVFSRFTQIIEELEITKPEDVAKIKTAIDTAHAFISEKKKEERKDLAETLSAKYGVDQVKIEELLEDGKMDAENLEELLKSLKESNSYDGYKKNNKKKDEKKSPFNESRTSRIMSNFK